MSEVMVFPLDAFGKFKIFVTSDRGFELSGAVDRETAIALIAALTERLEETP